MRRMSFYEFMAILDKITIEECDKDFRNWEVRCNRILDRDFLYIKDLEQNGKIIHTIVLDDGKMGVNPFD
jgi:hypothetical protein